MNADRSRHKFAIKDGKDNDDNDNDDDDDSGGPRSVYCRSNSILALCVAL